MRFWLLAAEIYCPLVASWTWPCVVSGKQYSGDTGSTDIFWWCIDIVAQVSLIYEWEVSHTYAACLVGCTSIITDQVFTTWSTSCGYMAAGNRKHIFLRNWTIFLNYSNGQKWAFGFAHEEEKVPTMLDNSHSQNPVFTSLIFRRQRFYLQNSIALRVFQKSCPLLRNVHVGFPAAISNFWQRESSGNVITLFPVKVNLKVRISALESFT
jgi:hypothetical protein